MRNSIFILLALCLSIPTIAQDTTKTETTTRKRVPNLTEEIANLTRTPLGEGDLRLELWIQYTVEERGRTRSGRIYFSDESTAIAWIDDLARPKSFFFRASPTEPIITVIPSINQGTQLTESMMKAMGFISDSSEQVKYSSGEDAAISQILGRECLGASCESDGKVWTMWTCGKSEIKREERGTVSRGVEIWALNQTTINPIKSAIIEEGAFVLGFDSEGYEFRVLDWGFEGDFVIALDNIMVNVPGRDLNQVAKEYVEELERKKEEEGQKED
jgi:hypothetical protein